MLDPITPFLPFLGALLETVPRLVGNWMETRNAIRVEHTRAILTENLEQASHRRSLELEEYSAVAAWYPLGTPGRLRSMLGSSGLPTILISPLPPNAELPSEAIPARIQQILGDIDDIETYAQVVTGAFVRSANQSRFIDGEVGARTVARYEFGREPAILIYFEQASNTLTARAYLSTVFGNVGGDSSFSFVIARYGRTSQHEAPALTELGGDLPAWHNLALDAFPELDPEDIVAYTISWFIIAAVDAYWELKLGIRPGLLTSVGVGDLAEHPELTNADDGTYGGCLGSDPARHARLEREAQRLTQNGFEVTAEEITDRHVGLHVRGAGKDIVFVLDERFPSSPPTRIQTPDTTLEIDASDWSPECMLMDVVEALP